MIYTNLTMSLSREQVPPIVPMVQGDNGRGLRITLTDDVLVEETGEVDSSLSAQMWVKKPSGKEVSMNATQIIRYSNSNSYQIIFDGSDTFANALAEEGLSTAQVILTSGESYVTSFDIIFKVQGNIAVQSDIISSTEYSNIIQLINEFNAQKAELDDYISQFKDQLKLTVNVRYGTGVPTVQSGDKEGDLYIRIG